MAKKAKIRRCIDCPYCVDIHPSWVIKDYVCTYGNKTKELENVLIIPDWCPLEEWGG